MEIIDLLIKPDPEEPAAAGVLVEASLDGQPTTFLLDTGAARSNVIWDERTKHYDAMETVESSGLFATNHYDVIEVNSLRLGTREFHNVKLHRQQQASSHAQNLIGMDLLKHHRCLFDFETNRLFLDPSEAMTKGLSMNRLIMDQRDHPYLQMALGPVKAQATWDTGAGVTVVDTRLIEESADFFTEGMPSQGTDSSGTTRETPMYLMAGAAIDEQTFVQHRVAGVDLSHVNAQVERPMDMILGYTTLRQANWYFDFPGQRWGITRML